MDLLRLNPAFRVLPLPDGVVIVSGEKILQLQGPDLPLFLEQLLPLLAAGSDATTLAGRLPEYSPASVLEFLHLLAEHGAVDWAAGPEPAPTARARLQAARVLLAGLEPWVGALAAGLGAAGVGTISRISMRPLQWTERRSVDLRDTAWDLIVGALPAADLAGGESLARFAHESGVVSLYGTLDGHEVRIGPVVVPGRTACWNCARLRQLAHTQPGAPGPAQQAPPWMPDAPPASLRPGAPAAGLVGHLLVQEALQILTATTPAALEGRLLLLDIRTYETSGHLVIPMPWCAVCGGAAGRVPLTTLPPDLTAGNRTPADPAPTASEPLGEIRTPAALRRRLAGWVDARTGVIKHLALGSPDGQSTGLPICCVAVAVPFTDGSAPAAPAEDGHGKGLTAVSAMLGAVGEALERYSAARCPPQILRRATLAGLDGEFLDPRDLSLYDETQYATPDFPFARVDPAAPLDWTQGRWLDSAAPVWLPALPVFARLPVPAPERFCQVTSDGLAAGMGLEDAALRAVFELIERDAFMLTWLCRRPARRLLLDDTAEAGVREVVRQLEARGADVEVYLLQTGVRVPTVVCLALGDGQRWPGVTVGLAAHLSPRTAIRKAILEQGQVGPYLHRLAVTGEHPIPAEAAGVHSFLDHALYYAPPARAPAFDFLRRGPLEPVRLSGLPEPQTVTLAACLPPLREADVRVAIADVTAPDVAVASPFRVVRALGPRMQPLHYGAQYARLANPRLQAVLTQPVNSDPHPVC